MLADAAVGYEEHVGEPSSWIIGVSFGMAMSSDRKTRLVAAHQSVQSLCGSEPSNAFSSPRLTTSSLTQNAPQTVRIASDVDVETLLDLASETRCDPRGFAVPRVVVVGWGILLRTLAWFAEEGREEYAASCKGTLTEAGGSANDCMLRGRMEGPVGSRSGGGRGM